MAIGAWNDRLKDVTEGAFDGAKTAVTIALGLLGVIALWLGVMRLARHAIPAGLVADLTGVIASVILCRLVLRGPLLEPEGEVKFTSPAAIAIPYRPLSQNDPARLPHHRSRHRRRKRLRKHP